MSKFIGQFAWSACAQIDANFSHDLYDLGMDVIARFGTGGDGFSVRRIDHRREKGRCHLRAAGVVDAGEDDAFH